MMTSGTAAGLCLVQQQESHFGHWLSFHRRHGFQKDVRELAHLDVVIYLFYFFYDDIAQRKPSTLLL